MYSCIGTYTHASGGYNVSINNTNEFIESELRNLLSWDDCGIEVCVESRCATLRASNFFLRFADKPEKFDILTSNCPRENMSLCLNSRYIYVGTSKGIQIFHDH